MMSISEILSAITPVIGIMLGLVVWSNSRFNLRALCLQLNIISYLFLFCLLYLSDLGTLVVKPETFSATLRTLSLIGLICTSTHLFIRTKRINRYKQIEAHQKKESQQWLP